MFQVNNNKTQFGQRVCNLFFFLLADKGNNFNESDAVHIAEMLEVCLHICQKHVFSQLELIVSLNQNVSN